MSQYHRACVPIAGVMAALVGGGVLAIYVFSMFAKQIALDFEWSRSTVAFGATVFSLMNGIGAVFLGRAMDKWGMKRTTLIMIAIFGLSLCSLSLIPASVPIYLTVFAIIGFSGAAATIYPYSLAISAWFDQSRGLMIGIMNVGTGIGGILLPLVAAYMLANYGWREGYVVIGILAFLLPCIALVWLLKLPDDFEADRKRLQASHAQQSIWQLFVESRQLKILMLGIFLVAFATLGFLSQLAIIVGDKQLGPLEIAGVMSAASLASTVSRFATGVAMDYIPARFVAAFLFLLASAGIWFVTAHDSYLMLVIGGALLGIGLGAEADVMTFMTSRYFELHKFGSVIGLLHLMFTWGGAAGIYLLSMSFDAFGNYIYASYAFMAVVAIGVMCLLSLGPYKFPPAPKQKASA